MDVLLASGRLQWQDAVDLLVLTVALYATLSWARENRAARMAVGVVCLHLAAVGTSKLGLAITGWVLHAASLLALLVLLVLFQPEVRHSLVHLDRFLMNRGRPQRLHASVPAVVSEAAFAMAGKRVGALITITNTGSLSEEVAHGGTAVGARVSRELLEAIFLRDSQLHDGAAVIEGDRITRAGVLLPVTTRRDIPSHFGTRHRAAVGLADCCDALVVVVSEELGEVRLIHSRQIHLMESAAALFQQLQDLQERPRVGSAGSIRRLLFSNLGLKTAAVMLAAVVWLLYRLGAAGA
jgi:uncharacterized protein (TIGR00159 family)